MWDTKIIDLTKVGSRIAVTRHQRELGKRRTEKHTLTNEL